MNTNKAMGGQMPMASQPQTMGAPNAAAYRGLPAWQVPSNNNMGAQYQPQGQSDNNMRGPAGGFMGGFGPHARQQPQQPMAPQMPAPMPQQNPVLMGRPNVAQMPQQQIMAQALMRRF